VRLSAATVRPASGSTAPEDDEGGAAGTVVVEGRFVDGTVVSPADPRGGTMLVVAGVGSDVVPLVLPLSLRNAPKMFATSANTMTTTAI
jgi:hypothetical protein